MLNRTSSYIAIKKAMEAYYIPQRMIPGFHRYLVGGIKPGSFWVSLLEGDYKSACVLADSENLQLIGQYYQFLTDQVTPHAHGSSSIVWEWMASFRDFDASI